MARSVGFRRAGEVTVLCLAVLAVCISTGMAAADGPWWEVDGDATKAAGLDAVFGGAAAAWDIVLNRQSARPETTQWNGRTVLATDAKTAYTLNYAAESGVDREYIFVLGFPEKGAATQQFVLTIGRKSTDNAEPHIDFRLSRSAGETVQVRSHNWFIPKKGTVSYADATFFPRGNQTMQLGWPEKFRRRVEHLFGALPSLDEQWVTLRVVTTANRCRAYVNGQLGVEWTVTPEQVTGRVACSLNASGIVLAQARVRRVGVDSRFVSVPLGLILNTAELDGKALDRESLPTPATLVEVDGVPFEFSAPDARNNDHVDVGESWFQHGLLEGYFGSRYNVAFGSRWANPLLRNPGRLQVAVPRAQYCRIHLIAASDGGRDSIPEVTAQFYRPYGGYPQEVSAGVPTYDARAVAASALSVSRGGRKANLYHIVIPIDPGSLSDLALMDRESVALGLEFTKRTRLYRSYPDPISYSYHGAGLPSGVHIYAATLEVPVAHLDVQPDAVGHVWTSPARPSYTFAVTHSDGAPRTVTLEIATRSHDGEEETTQTREVTVAPAGESKVTVSLPVKKYGYHDLTVTMRDGEETWTEKRGLAFLHAETRDRDWQAGRGPVFGTWSYAGGHTTPPLAYSLEVMGQAGLQARGGSLYHILYEGGLRAARDDRDELMAIARKYKMFSFKRFWAGDHYITGKLAADLRDGSAEEAEKKFLEELKRTESQSTEFSRTEMISFFPEPHIQPAPNYPLYYGEPEHVLTEAERVKFDYYGKALLHGAKVLRKEWPDLKIALPHGDPLFTVPYLRAGGEYLKAIDGMAVDSPGFERVPEMQVGQYTIHRQWQLSEEMKRAGMTDPYFIFLEGNFLPTNDGALTLQQQADYQVRNTLHYYAYGINRLTTVVIDYDAADYYGEEHYGAGICTRYPLACPKPAYASMAALTRQLNGMNFVGYVPTGSATVFCLQYKHWKDESRILHVLWTVRGTRPVSLSADATAKVERYDLMDNATTLEIENGEVGMTLDGSPYYVWGLSDATKVRLGEPDHSDSLPGEHLVALGNLGDGSWEQRAERDDVYENNWPGQMARFLGKMSVSGVDAPEEQGNRALAVHFGEQEKERITMPWYTALYPKRPIEIPGKACHLGLWVKANSDWGRVVYSLRDDEGERWVSIGTREQWNCDDIHCWSKFNFDGWRYLRFELPANSPYDQFREVGTTWWGHFGQGDGVVDLPLKLEKILVERRSHVMYVNEPIPADTGDVLLGQLNAEYERKEDSGREALRLAGLEMPLPTGKVELDNPVARMRETGTLPAPAISGVEDPKQQANGTQCHVLFDPVEGAVSYDIWVAPYEDGRGAMKLAANWKEPGGMMRGVRPEVDFYLFLVYANEKKEPSKPSAAYHIKLKDLFFQK